MKRVADSSLSLSHALASHSTYTIPSLCSSPVFAIQKTRAPIAIKAVSRQKLTQKLLENLESEINILKAISHRNIVSLEDCFVSVPIQLVLIALRKTTLTSIS